LLARHLRLNLWFYLLVTVTLITGTVVGAMRSPAAVEADLVNQLLSRLTEGQPGVTLMQCLINQLPWWLTLGLLGLTVIGVLLVLPLVFFKGYCVGYTVYTLAKADTDTGLGLALTAVLPHNLIYIPCLLVLAAAAIKFSGVLFSPGRDSGTLIRSLLSYVMIMIMTGAVMAAGALIESEVTPWLLSWW